MPNRRLQNNEQEKLVRDARIWELRALNAWTERQIAKEIGLSQVGVHKILERQTKEYKTIYWEKIDTEKSIQIFALKKVAQEMWDAWNKSKSPQKVVRQFGIAEDSKGVKNIEIKDSHGDPRYMELYLKALKDIRDILGINAATEVHAKIEINDNTDTSLSGFLDELSKRVTQGEPRAIN